MTRVTLATAGGCSEPVSSPALQMQIRDEGNAILERRAKAPTTNSLWLGPLIQSLSRFRPNCSAIRQASRTLFPLSARLLPSLRVVCRVCRSGVSLKLVAFIAYIPPEDWPVENVPSINGRF